ncbi:MAG TPA: hypothetical protein VF206_02485, partial [Rubrobacter sp.]
MDLHQRLSYRCLSAQASFGAIAASCGEDGLNILFDEFSWVGRAGSRTVASPLSIRASYASLGLVNYTSRADFLVLSGTLAERTSKATQRAFVDFSPTAFGSSDLLHRLVDSVDVTSDDDLEYAANVGSSFVALIRGKIVTLAIRLDHTTGHRRFLTPHVHGEYSGRVVSASLLGDDLVVHTQDSVLVVQ